MGMYTQLVLGVDLSAKTPNNIIDILKYMLDVDAEEDKCPELPDHPLFETDRWRYMLLMASAEFDGGTNSQLKPSKYSKIHHLNIRCSLKNYDFEIEKFINFIEPYVLTRGFWGYKWYEENDYPDLIYHDQIIQYFHIKYNQN